MRIALLTGALCLLACSGTIDAAPEDREAEARPCHARKGCDAALTDAAGSESGAASDSGAAPEGSTLDDAIANDAALDAPLADAAPGSKPGAGNSGVPVGTALRPYTGSCTITTTGTVLDAVEASCVLVIAAADVTVRRSHFGGLLVRDATRTLVEDTTTDQGVAISSSSYVTFRRNDFHGPGDGLHITSDGSTMCEQILLEGNWIHAPVILGADHYDVMQVRGVRNLIARGNNFDAGPFIANSEDGGTNAAIYFENANGGNDNVLVDGNWLNGGGYMIYTSASNARFLNNRIGRDHKWGLLYTPGVPFVESGNVWEDTGAPVRLQP